LNAQESRDFLNALGEIVLNRKNIIIENIKGIKIINAPGLVTPNSITTGGIVFEIISSTNVTVRKNVL
jgi:hypothetical protein